MLPEGSVDGVKSGKINVNHNNNVINKNAGKKNKKNKRSKKKYSGPGRAAPTKPNLVVPGIKPEKKNKTPKIVVPLLQFYLKDDLIRVLDRALQPFTGITKKQLASINLIKSLKEIGVNCLNRGNYANVLDLCLFLEEYEMNLDIQEYDLSGQSLKIVPYDYRLLELEVPGLAEHRPSILVGDSVYIQDELLKNGIIYQGIVHKVFESSVLLGFDKGFRKSFITGRQFYVEFDFSRFPLRVEHRAAETVEKHKIKKFFFPPNIPRHILSFSNSLNWFNKNVATNEPQKQAIHCILNKTAMPHPYLIFGPPGTGKTMTVVEAVKQLHFTSPANILICAPSNDAANEITSRLVDTIPKRDLLRLLSGRFRIDDIPEQIKKFTNFSNGFHYYPTKQQIMGYRIVVCTLITASRLITYGVPWDHFNFVVIDESGHATESETLVPIAGMISSQKTSNVLSAQIVLAGDPKQLGPIIHSQLAKDIGFGVSMLERLMNTSPAYQKEENRYNPALLTKLLKNYRSHPVILKTPNELFYDNELEAAGKDLINLCLGWDQLPNPTFPMVFHSVVGKDQREKGSPSFFNLQEVEVVMNYVSSLLNTRFKGIRVNQEQIGIITPYRKQVEKLKNACGQRRYQKITIGSVEQFQGQERLIIIISTVRSQPSLIKFDEKFHLGFVSNPKRLNVAITRAKALLIIIGNPHILQHDKNWRELIKYCKDNNALAGESFEMVELNENLTAQLQSLEIEDEIRNDETPNFSRANN